MRIIVGFIGAAVAFGCVMLWTLSPSPSSAKPDSSWHDSHYAQIVQTCGDYNPSASWAACSVRVQNG